MLKDEDRNEKQNEKKFKPNNLFFENFFHLF